MGRLITEEWATRNADLITNWEKEVWHRLPDFSTDFILHFKDEINLINYFCYLCQCKSRSIEMRRVAVLLEFKYLYDSNGETPWVISIMHGNIEAIKFLIDEDSYTNLNLSRKLLKLKVVIASGKGYTRKNRVAFRKFKRCLSYLTKFENRQKCQKNIQKNGI